MEITEKLAEELGIPKSVTVVCIKPETLESLKNIVDNPKPPTQGLVNAMKRYYEWRKKHRREE